MDNPHVLVVRSEASARVPVYAHDDDAGADLAIVEDVTLAPGERRVVGTGIQLAIPAGFAGFVYPRSGLAARCGLSMVNSPGVIDAGYRGEIRICLLNTDRHDPIHLSAGDLVAQMVIQPVAHVVFTPTHQLPDSGRGAGGYGSSGGVAAWRTA
ncbi:MAG: dUTP diphosphatase [Propionibacteriaceae bacterium]|nr:dUTP diphosphatase [Propionibacteriaceae bacterium]